MCADERAIPLAAQVTSYTHLLDEREAAAGFHVYGDAADAPRRKPTVAVEDEARLRIAQLAAVRAEVRFRLMTLLSALHTCARAPVHTRAHERVRACTRVRVHAAGDECAGTARHGTARTLRVVD